MSEIKHLTDDVFQPEATAPTEGTSDSAGITIDYRRLLETAKKYFWVIILYLVAGLSVAVIYLVNATPIYRSVARLQIEQRVMSAAPMIGMDPAEDLRGLEMLQTIQLAFVSRSLMAQVVERMNLKNRPDFVKNTPIEGEVDEEAYIQYLLSNTECQLIQGTRLMTVSFDHPDRHVAQEMVDTLIKEYIALEKQQRLDNSAQNLSFLIEESKSLEENLIASQKKLSDYTVKLGNISVEGEINIIAGQLIELNTRLGVAKAERLKLEADSQQIQKYRDDPKALMEIASVAGLPEIAALRSQLNTIDAEISRMKRRYKLDNPQLTQFQSQRDSLQKALEAEALRAPQTVDRTLQAAIGLENSLQQVTNEQEKKVIETKKLSIESKVLERKIAVDTDAFQTMRKQYTEQMSQARSQPVFIQVIDPAGPTFKVKPRELQVLLIAAIASLIAAAGTIFLLTSLDTSFKSVDELESALGIQVLAAIPQYELITKDKKAARAAGATPVFPLIDDPYSAASEAYRTLRASLLLVEDDTHSILVTSAVPEEGKSTTSINLAICMAQRGARTLLIEGDLRKPVMQTRLLGRPGMDMLGVSDFLSDKADFDEIILETSVPNLSLITAGRVSKNSGELLLRRPRVEKLLELARKGYDQVIVDSAPLLAVSDTLTFARHFNIINLVVRSHKTPRRLVKRSVDILKRIRRTPVGVALSIVPPGNDYYYYGYTEGGDRAYGAARAAAVATESAKEKASV
jgi:succinoglycan biosynthesis transport protein ExoP